MDKINLKKTANIVTNGFNKWHTIKQGTPKHGKTEQWELVLISEIDEKVTHLSRLFLPKAIW